MHLTGYFNEFSEPALQLDLFSKSLEVLIDTGFAGGLIVPQDAATGLTLHFEGFEEFYTVTGHTFVAPSFSVDLNWFGEQTRVPVATSAEVGEALLGAQMLRDCRLTIDYPSRSVRIERAS